MNISVLCLGRSISLFASAIAPHKSKCFQLILLVPSRGLCAELQTANPQKRDFPFSRRPNPTMKTILFITAVLGLAIVAPNPVLDRWQAGFRAEMRASIADYLPNNPASAQERALLHEIGAQPDSPAEGP